MTQNKHALWLGIACLFVGYAVHTFQSEHTTTRTNAQRQETKVVPIATPIEQTQAKAVASINWEEWPQDTSQIDRPAFVYFTQEKNCPACVWLENNIWNDEDIVRQLDSFLCIRFICTDKSGKDTEYNRNAMKAFGVDRAQGLPQAVFIDRGWGKMHKSYLPDQISKHDFSAWLVNWYGRLNQRKK